MKKLLFVPILMMALGAFAQDHTSIRGRLSVSESSELLSINLNLIRTGQDANKVLFADAFSNISDEFGYTIASKELVYFPYENTKGPTASYLFEYNLNDKFNTLSIVRFRVSVLLEQKDMPMGDWPRESWLVLFDCKTGKMSSTKD